MKNKKQPVINGDGTFSRDFTYIDNVVQANILALTTENTKCFGEVFNIGAGGRVTILELFNVIKTNMELDINPLFHKERDGDVPHSNADISKAKELLSKGLDIFNDIGMERSIHVGNFELSKFLYFEDKFQDAINKSKVKCN